MNLTANCLYLLAFLKTPLKHKYAYFFNVNCSLMLLPTTMTITTTIMYFKGKLCFCFRLDPYLFNLMELIKAQHGGYSLASQQEDPGFEATSREPLWRFHMLYVFLPQSRFSPQSKDMRFRLISDSLRNVM